MSILRNGFHPTFDALSAHADQSDVDAARTRVGRHVSRCAACAAEVAEIRALGDAARAVELPGTPAGLWARIERAQAAAPAASPARETPPPDADVYQPAPALRPTRHIPLPGRRGMRRVGLGLAAAAVVAGVLLYPMERGAPLQAAAPDDVWRILPAHPMPGSEVTVRFVPAPGGDPKLPALLLLGGLTRRWDGGLPPVAQGRFQDSLATLVRGSDGTYSGRFTLADTVRALVLRLAAPGGAIPRRVMSPAGPVARDHEAVTLLVTGDAAHRPSLAALALVTDAWVGRDVRAYHVADTLVKYYPDEPTGYAVRRDMPTRRLLDDVIAWFKSGEREYLRFDRRFMAQARPSAEHELAMIWFANRIAEPGEERKWTLRLARDHGDDPRALYSYGGMLHGMLLRPGTIDSVRRDLPLADSLWERNGHRAGDAWIGAAALEARDTAAARRWAVRAALGGALDYRGQPVGVEPFLLRDPAARAQLERRARDRVAGGCDLPSGRYPVWSSAEAWREACTNSRGYAYGTLAEIALLSGRPAAALALADSGASLLSGRDRCWQGGPRRQRGMARLALGDTAGAATDLAEGAIGSSWQSIARRDSLGRMLAPAVDAARWRALVAAAERESQACLAGFAARDRARADSLKAAGSR